MAGRLLRRLVSLFNSPATVLVALLLATFGFPKSELVMRLRGHGGIEAELNQARGLGYYERLIGAAETRSGRDSGGPQAWEPVHPPPGFVAFANSGIPEADPGYRRWRLRPGLDVRWNGTRVRTNHLGYRGPEITPAKPPGTCRIVVLGSSNTMGHGVDDEDGYVRRLERWLQDRAGPGRRVEVVNLAVPGETPSQHLYRLRHEVEALDPDWILCDASVVDISFEEMHLHTISGLDVPIPFDYVRSAIERAGASKGDSLEGFCRRMRAVFHELLDGAYAGWAAEAKRLGVPLTVLILPRADERADNPYLFELIRTTAGRHGLDYVDLSDAFAGLEVEQFRIGPWDRHPNPSGHRVLFERLRDELIRRGDAATLLSTPSTAIQADL